jgi:hypothetical protein
VTLGLACLRVPLESGSIGGTFAPLAGLLVTLWGLGSAAARASRSRSASRWRDVAVVGVVFALVCALAALAAEAAGSPVEGTTTEGGPDSLGASVAGAAVAGLAWGALAAAWATRTRGGRLWDSLAPGIAGAAVALGLAVVWFLVAAAVWLEGSSGVPARELGGGGVIAVSLAPNAGAAVAAVGLGGEAELVIEDSGPRSADSISLWNWIGRTRPWHRFLLVLGPLVGAIVAGRLAAARMPRRDTLVHGLVNGAVLGVAVVIAGWLASGTVAVEEGVRARLGLAAQPVALLIALVWGVAGAYVGPRVALPRGVAGLASRVRRP